MPKIRVLREVGPFLKSAHIFIGGRGGGGGGPQLTNQCINLSNDRCLHDHDAQMVTI